jgi:hypothetical protein
VHGTVSKLTTVAVLALAVAGCSHDASPPDILRESLPSGDAVMLDRIRPPIVAPGDVARLYVLTLATDGDPVAQTVQALRQHGWRDLGNADGGNGVVLRELDLMARRVRVIVLDGQDGVRWEGPALLSPDPVGSERSGLASAMSSAVGRAGGPVVVVELRRIAAGEAQ